MTIIRVISPIPLEEVGGMLNVSFQITYDHDRETIVLMDENGDLIDAETMQWIGQYLILAANKVQSDKMLHLHERDWINAEIKQRLFDRKKGRWYVYCDNCRKRLDSYADYSYYTLSVPYKRQEGSVWTRHCSEECANVYVDKKR